MTNRLRTTIAALLVGCTTILAARAPAQVPSGANVVRETALDKPEVTTSVEGLRSSLNIPSMAVAIFDTDGLLYRKTLGGATPDSRFYVGSLTKALTATLVLRLASQGALDLDDAARRHAPFDLPRPLRVVDLLHHRSGIPREMGFASWNGGVDDLAAHVESLELEAGPHTFEYSNLNYAILGRIVEQVTGTPFREALHAKLLEPLGMEQTHAAPAPDRVPHLAPGRQYLFGPTMSSPEAPYYGWEIPSRFVAMSLGDAVRLGQLHLAEGDLESSRLLEAAHVRRMFRPPNEKNTGHAMGWFIEHHAGLEMARHEGWTTSYHASMALLPERDLGVVVLANVNSYGAGAAGMLAENLALMAAGEETATLTNFEFVLRLALGALLVILVIWFLVRLYRWSQRSFRIGLLPGAGWRLLSPLALGAGLVVGLRLYFEVPLLAIWTVQPDLALGLLGLPLLSFLSMLLGEFDRAAEVESEATDP